MGILLASAPHADTFGYSMPPPGLLRLGGWLRDAGIEVRLEDLAFRLAAGELPASDELGLASAELLVERMDKAMGPWALGLSTMGATLPIALVIARHVRRLCPGVPILLGGPGICGCDERVLHDYADIDAIVRGEGEVTVSELMQGRFDGAFDYKGVAGVTWRTASGEIVREPKREVLADLDDVASPAWELLPAISAYKEITGESDGLVPIDSGRGCAFDCSFCTIGRYWNRRSRVLSPGRLADEIHALGKLPGAKAAYLCHDIFGANRSSALAFCETMSERASQGGSIPWEVRARVDHLDSELIDAMSKAGCYRVLLGIESAAESVRVQANKPLSGALARDEILATIQNLCNAGITPIISLILGLPGEGDTELRDTLDFAAEASTAGAVQLSFHLVNPQPGCDLGERFAAGSEPLEGIAPDMALGAGLTQPEQELIQAAPELFSSWNLLTCLPGGEAHIRYLHGIAKTLPMALMRYPRTIAAIKRHLKIDTLGFAELLSESTCSLEGLARRLGDPLVDDLLLWELTRLRVAARGPVRIPFENRNDAPLRVLVDTIQVRFELGEIDAQLNSDAALPGPSEPPINYAIGTTIPGSAPAAPTAAEGAIQTLRISDDLAQLLDILRSGDIAPGGPLGDHPRSTIEQLANVAGGSLVSILPAP
jgi:radical SAM superfamily enzyme YgiQ (UPF0313 family)